ncbi:nucleotidyltransferase domain-containing protein [Lachnospiraceae bacterium 62-35]
MIVNTGIRPIVIEELCALAKKYDIVRLILFGSRARGDYKRTSDIDLAVTGGAFVPFALDVEEETSTLLKFDVVNLDGAVQPELRNSILKEGKILYEKV